MEGRRGGGGANLTKCPESLYWDPPIDMSHRNVMCILNATILTNIKLHASNPNIFSLD